MEQRFCIGDKVVHPEHGLGTILGNWHQRHDNRLYVHVAYKDGTFGYNVENALSPAPAGIVEGNRENIVVKRSLPVTEEKLYEILVFGKIYKIEEVFRRVCTLAKLPEPQPKLKWVNEALGHVPHLYTAVVPVEAAGRTIPFYQLTYIGKLADKKDSFAVYEVPESLFNALVEEPSEWVGWYTMNAVGWRHSTGMVDLTQRGYKFSPILIQKQLLPCGILQKGLRRGRQPAAFSGLFPYLEAELGISTDKNVTAALYELAKLNGMSLSQFLGRYNV